MSAEKNLPVLFLFNHQLSEVILSGGERMFLEVSKRFGKFGLDSYAVVPELAVDAIRKENLQFQLFTIPSFKIEYRSYLETPIDQIIMVLIFFYRTLYGSVRVFKWLRLSKAKVVYTTADFFPDTVPVVVAKLFGKRIKWVSLVHHIIDSPFRRRGMSLFSNLGAFLMQRFSFFLIKHFADGVFIKNEGVKKELSSIGFDAAKMFVIDNGIDLEMIEGMPGEYDTPFEACYVGRLSASKGISDLIEIWSVVVSKMPKARLAIIGGGSVQLEEAKRAAVKEMGLEKNIKVLGSLPNEQAYRIRKTSKLFVSCSYEEGWGITIAEALACGVPCVAYDLPVYTEKFEGAVALAPVGDIAGFAAKVEELLGDEAKRSEMAQCGKELVKKYELDDVVKREVDVIKRIVKPLYD